MVGWGPYHPHRFMQAVPQRAATKTTSSCLYDRCTVPLAKIPRIFTSAAVITVDNYQRRPHRTVMRKIIENKIKLQKLWSAKGQVWKRMLCKREKKNNEAFSDVGNWISLFASMFRVWNYTTRLSKCKLYVCWSIDVFDQQNISVLNYNLLIDFLKMWFIKIVFFFRTDFFM